MTNRDAAAVCRALAAKYSADDARQVVPGYGHRDWYRWILEMTAELLERAPDDVPEA